MTRCCRAPGPTAICCWCRWAAATPRWRRRVAQLGHGSPWRCTSRRTPPSPSMCGPSSAAPGTGCTAHRAATANGPRNARCSVPKPRVPSIEARRPCWRCRWSRWTPCPAALSIQPRCRCPCRCPNASRWQAHVDCCALIKGCIERVCLRCRHSMPVMVAHAGAARPPGQRPGAARGSAAAGRHARSSRTLSCTWARPAPTPASLVGGGSEAAGRAGPVHSQPGRGAAPGATTPGQTSWTQLRPRLHGDGARRCRERLCSEPRRLSAPCVPKVKFPSASTPDRHHILRGRKPPFQDQPRSPGSRCAAGSRASAAAPRTPGRSRPWRFPSAPPGVTSSTISIFASRCFQSA